MSSGTRYLGVDFGTKRVGLALSDEEGMLAFPRGVIPSRGAEEAIAKMVGEEEVGGIVLGESLSYKGEKNAVMEQLSSFKERLEDLVSVPVVFEREFMTSVEARRFQDGKRAVDDSAAALILQRHLDRLAVRKNHGNNTN